ncbi:MAG: hypothetical protein AAF125_16715, partial [Chloroflexota bacterium]
MTGNEIVQADPFTVEAPAPGEWFERRIIAEPNQRVTKAEEQEIYETIIQAKLTRGQRRQIRKAIKKINAQLKAHNYYVLREQLDQIV